MAKAEATVVLNIEYASVWAVIYSNYEPREVGSLWATRELAQAEADRLEGPWNVEEMFVGRTSKEASLPGLRVDDQEAQLPGAEGSGLLADREETQGGTP